MPRIVTRLVRSDGQTMAEYSVMLGLITAAIVALIGGLSGAFENTISNVVEIF
jgi:Flp pilus assembly pilin Flp